jgi:hypothetical protein
MTSITNRLPNGQNAATDLLGRRFGKLTIIAKEPGRSYGYLMWRARCDCGNEMVMGSYRYVNKRYGIKQCKPCQPIGRPRIPHNGSHFNHLFKVYSQAARVREIEWNLTKEAFRELCEGDCHYCGAPPQIRRTHKNLSGSFNANGVDRMDSDQGYVANNVVSCCILCNRAKNDSSYAEFTDWLDRVARFRG